MQVKNVISPLDVIKVLNGNRVSFVLVGAHGLAGWMKKPRATQDVDVVVAERQVKKATRVLLDTFSGLEAEDQDVVVRLKDSEDGTVRIDLMRPRELYRGVFQHTHPVSEGGEEYRVPSLEMALAMKFAAMTSPNRPLEKTYQDAHDFIVIAKENLTADDETLRQLGERVYSGGGEDLLDMLRKARAGERLIL
jgi:hypothetical protein